MNIASHPKTIIFAGFLLISLISFAAYNDIGNHEFLHWDDNFYVDGNKNIHSLNWDNILWMFTNHASANWHPLTWLSYAVDFQFWGKNAFVFKITNLILHLLNAFLIFVLTLKLLNLTMETASERTRFKIFAGIFAALLFSVHPQHVESVAWISGRKDILCTLFYLAGIISYLIQDEKHGSQQWGHLTLLLFVFALMSKSMAVTFPLILLLLDIYPLKRIEFGNNAWPAIKSLVVKKLHYFLISFSVGSITLITQNNEMQSLTSFSLWDRLANASMNILHYFYTIFYPFDIQAYYPLNIGNDNHIILHLFAITVVITIFVACIYFWRRDKKYFLLAWLFYIVTLLPVIGLLKVGHASAADRYAYLPTIGFYIVLGSLISNIIFINKGPILRAITIGTGSFVVFFLVIKTDINTQHWKNDMTLWSSVVEAFPNKVIVAHNNLGGVYVHREQYGNALEQFYKSAEIQPNNIGTLENIATCYTKLGRIDIALEYYKKSVDLNPGSPLPLITLGDFYNVRNKLGLADQYYQRAFEISPTSPKILLRSAYMDYVKGNYDSAALKLSYLEKMSPDNYKGLQLQAKIKLAEKQFSEAENLARRILSIKPEDSLALEVLSIVGNNTNTH